MLCISIQGVHSKKNALNEGILKCNFKLLQEVIQNPSERRSPHCIYLKYVPPTGIEPAISDTAGPRQYRFAIATINNRGKVTMHQWTPSLFKRKLYSTFKLVVDTAYHHVSVYYMCLAIYAILGFFSARKRSVLMDVAFTRALYKNSVIEISVEQKKIRSNSNRFSIV